MDLLDALRRAQDGFDAVLTRVPNDRWDVATPCSEWTVRDIVGHVVWGLEAIRAGVPAPRHPGSLAGDDPVAAWRAARDAIDAVLRTWSLDRTVVHPGLGEMPLGELVAMLRTDTLAHTWDVGTAVGRVVRLDADVLPDAFAWVRDTVGETRSPRYFAAPVEPPDDADEQEAFLAYLGRTPGTARLPRDLRVVERDVVRVVLRDAEERILLFHTFDPTNPDVGRWWELPGGGIDPGESYLDTAVREVHEETGIRLDRSAVGPPLWWRTATYRYRGERRLQHERVVEARVDAVAPGVDGSLRVGFEDEDYFGHAWWSFADVVTSEERFYPGRLPEFLPGILAGERIDEPFELWS